MRCAHWLAPGVGFEHRRCDDAWVTNLKVRPWAPADLERIGLVHSQSRRKAYARLVPVEALSQVTPEQQTSVWTQRLANLPQTHAALVVEHEGEVVGFALAQLNPASGAQLNAIHVLPAHQGTGAGQALMDAVVDAFRAWGVSEAHLHMLEGNARAEAFYRRNGWRLRGAAGFHEIAGASVPISEYRLAIERAPRQLRAPSP